MRRVVIAALVLGLPACIDHPEAPTLPPGSEMFPPATTPPQQGTGPAQNGTTPKPSAKPALEVLTEATYVLMKSWDGGDWMCTGALVSKDIVVTAAHCLDESMFESWEIVAPLAKGKPRVSASNPRLWSYDYDDPGEPDIGFLHLDEPINLPAYAQLTDVTQRVEKGEKLTATTIVRTEEDFEAPFKSVDDLALSSTTDRGYTRGFGTPYFSHGGDSGAGLYLVESGQVTHKLIGIARQPEPDAKLDHFTRIDAELLAWFDENTNGQ